MSEMTRPDRSDAHLSPEEEAKNEEETREYFENIGPKRHTKPSRSEYSTQYFDARNNSDAADSIPEFQKLQDLETNDSKKLVYEGSEAVDEYVETSYYKDLDCADKQHHTTGTGFIKMENTNDNTFEIKSEIFVGSESHPSTKGNPATNEWIPSADTVFPVSDKPSRSDN